MRDRPVAPGPRAGVRRHRVATTVVLLGIVSLLTDVSTESVNAVLPLYLYHVLGLSALAFGLVNGLYNGASALLRVLGGWVADRTDHPKWVAAVGYAASALSRIGLLFAGTATSIGAVLTVDRLGKGLRTAPRDALIVGASEPAVLGRAFGVHRALDSLGAALGPLIAFWVLTVVVDGYHTVFVVSLAFAVVGVALLTLLVPDLRRTRATSATERPPRVSIRHLANPALARLVTASALLGVMTVGDAFLYLQLTERDDLAANYYPLLMVGMNSAYLVAAVPMGRLADRIGRARVFVGGHVALVVSYLCAAGPARGAVLTVGCLVMLGLFYAATDGTLAALAGRGVEPSLRASAIATAQTVQALAGLVSSVVIGILWNEYSLAVAIRLAGLGLVVLLPVAGLFVLRLDRRQRTMAT